MNPLVSDRNTAKFTTSYSFNKLHPHSTNPGGGNCPSIELLLFTILPNRFQLYHLIDNREIRYV